MDAFAWPGTVLVISLVFIIFFRRSISSKLTGLQQIDGKNKSITFDQNTKKKEAIGELKKERGFHPDLLKGLEESVTKESGIDKLKSEAEKLDALMKFSVELAITYHFDLIYEKILGSQIRLLQKLNAIDGIKKQEVMDYYQGQVESEYPVLKENYSFEQYFNFLVDESLITLDEEEDSKDTYFITISGRDFLSYLIYEGLNVDKNY